MLLWCGTMNTIFRYAAPLCLAVSFVLSCAGQTVPRASERVPPEKSVKPNINSEYLSPDLKVSQWVERFEREGREVFDRRREIVAAAKIRPGMIVGDIGSGTGLFTPLLLEAAGSKGKVYAVDIVPKFLDLIRERMTAAGVENVETVLCTERSVELPANSIDLAFICDVYHHFEYPHSSLASLHRAIRPGGEIFLVDFKRIPGESADWILNHVRAGESVVTAEIEAAGFEKVANVDLLKDNYIVRFRKLEK